MPFSIDIKTMIFVLAAINVFSALFFSAHHVMTTSRVQMRFFILSKAVQGFSWLIRLYFYTSSSGFMIILSDLLLLFGFAFESMLFVHFKNNFTLKMRLFYGISLSMVSLSIIVFSQFSIDIKNLILLISYLTYMSLIAWHLIRSKQTTPFQRLLGFLFALIPPLSTVLFIVINEEVTTFGYTTTLIGGIYYLSQLLMQTIGSVGYLLMVKEYDETNLMTIASKDSLTDILNRKAFYQKTEHIFEVSKSYKLPFCIIMMDIDHFKLINDTYGHLIGDQAIIHLTSHLKSVIRKDDLVARFGGEEFIICLPNATIEDAKHVVSRIRDIPSHVITKENTILPTFTLSIGIVTGIPDTEITLDEVIDKSDQALYHCKHNGRDCASHVSLDFQTPQFQRW